MATPRLPPDFTEFLRLLNESAVEYLLVGGYAVGYHGYVRATADMDVWIKCHVSNAPKAVEALRRFGFDFPELSEELLLQTERIIRMGLPPFRIELLTSVSGLSFDECFDNRHEADPDGVRVPIISLPDLKRNKLASGTGKDMVDLEHLP